MIELQILYWCDDVHFFSLLSLEIDISDKLLKYKSARARSSKRKIINSHNLYTRETMKFVFYLFCTVLHSTSAAGRYLTRKFKKLNSNLNPSHLLFVFVKIYNEPLQIHQNFNEGNQIDYL